MMCNETHHLSTLASASLFRTASGDYLRVTTSPITLHCARFVLHESACSAPNCRLS